MLVFILQNSSAFKGVHIVRGAFELEKENKKGSIQNVVFN